MQHTEKILRDLFLGFIRLHIVHRAAEDRIYGRQMIEELGRHGYHIGPSTLYPILHGLESTGLLRSAIENVDGRLRRYYSATAAGRHFLERARRQAAELVAEISPKDGEGHG